MGSIPQATSSFAAQGKPVARRGRKARGLVPAGGETARPPAQTRRSDPMLHPPLFLPAVWRWDTVRRATVVAALLAALAVVVPAASSASVSSPDLEALASRQPDRTVEV